MHSSSSDLDLDAVRRRLVRPGGPLSRLDWLPDVDSTNLEVERLARADPEAWSDLAVLGADHQRQGAGRRGRSFSAPPRAALIVSVLLRPDPLRIAEQAGWLPLLAGHALCATLVASGLEARIKWPNDILIGEAERKISGILGRIVGAGEDLAFIVGAGSNLHQSRAELPVAHATSAALEGCRLRRDEVLIAYLGRLAEVWGELRTSGPDAVRQRVEAGLSTLGREVVVEEAGGGEQRGTATGLGPHGELVLDGEMRVSAGDVHHLRMSAP